MSPNKISPEVMRVANEIFAALGEHPAIDPEEIQLDDKTFRIVARFNGTPVYVDVHWP